MKTIMGFNWVSTNCPGAKYVLFVDDDYIVNIKYLWDHLNRLYVAGQRSIFTGFLWTNAIPFYLVYKTARTVLRVLTQSLIYVLQSPNKHHL
jgi:hypothetical protein